MNKVLVVAVHPDDETLGCGGSLLRHKASGDEIYWLIVTDVHESNGFSQEIVDTRASEISKISSLYGFTKVYNLGFRTMRLEDESRSTLISAISKVFLEIKPDIVYLPFPGDAHSEHRFVFECSYPCTKTFRYPFVKQVLLMETLSETDFSPPLPDKVFQPNHFIDISSFMKEKISAMKIYKSEIAEHPFPRSEKSIEALGILRGSQAGVNYAEAFMVMKTIVK